VDGGTYNAMSAQNGLFDEVTEVVESLGVVFTVPDIYNICIHGVAGGQTGCDECFYLAVYDPSGGFVTGGGWITSPPGAYAADESLTGRANFGFVSKYVKNANVPAGNTQFHFNVADFRFDSTAYEYLIVSGPKARYWGTGTVNGVAGYGFELTAYDGQQPGGDGVDKFRIKIWMGARAPGNFVYDNMLDAPDGDDPTTILGGGNIHIQKK
jgi:hypothetical protein